MDAICDAFKQHLADFGTRLDESREVLAREVGRPLSFGSVEGVRRRNEPQRTESALDQDITAKKLLDGATPSSASSPAAPLKPGRRHAGRRAEAVSMELCLGGALAEAPDGPLPFADTAGRGGGAAGGFRNAAGASLLAATRRERRSADGSPRADGFVVFPDASERIHGFTRLEGYKVVWGCPFSPNFWVSANWRFLEGK